MVTEPRPRASEEPPLLSVAVVVGTQRERAQRVLAHLAAETIAPDIEVIVVDTQPAARALSATRVPPVRILRGDSLSYGEARAAAVHAAQAQIVAFLEDHCYPHPRWAEAVV